MARGTMMHISEEETQQDDATVFLWYCVCVCVCYTLFIQCLSVSLRKKQDCTHKRFRNNSSTSC